MTDVDKQGLDRTENKALEHKHEMHKTCSPSCMIEQATTSKRSKSTRYTGSKIAERGSTGSTLKGLRRGKPIMTIVLRQ